MEELGEGSATLHGSLSTAAPTPCMRLENAVKKSDIHKALCSHTEQLACVWRERLVSVGITHQIESSAGRPIGHGRLQGDGEQ